MLENLLYPVFLFLLLVNPTIQTYHSTGHYYSRTSQNAWSGRLILPLLSERNPDGSVFMQVYSCPDSEVEPDSIVRVAFDTNVMFGKDFVERSTFDSDISKVPEIVMKRIVKEEYIVPARLLNWNDVSSLESLAGAHTIELQIGDIYTADTIEVVLTHTKFENGIVYISKEPEIIIGRDVALIKFLDDDLNDERMIRVVHWNEQTREFDGDVEWVQIPEPFMKESITASFKSITKSPFSKTGWFIFGEKTSANHVLVRAMEPRVLNNLETPSQLRTFTTHKKFKEYFDKETWSTVREEKGDYRITDIINDPSISEWPVDEEYLLIDEYGSINGKHGYNMVRIPGVTQFNHGHLSYGYARVVIDKITGDKKLDVVYMQINPHANFDVISGFFKWASYMGDVNVKGKGYELPNHSAIIKGASFLTHEYTVVSDEKQQFKFTPLEFIKMELSIMGARNRLADSAGMAIVIPSRTCIIDSNMALFTAINRIKRIFKYREFQNFHVTLAEEDIPMIEMFTSWRYRYEKKVVGNAKYRSDWKDSIEGRKSEGRYGNSLVGLGRACFSVRTYLPKFGFAAFVASFNLLPMPINFREVKVNMMGGLYEGTTPTASGFDHKTTGKEIAGQ